MKAQPFRLAGKTYSPCEPNEATHVKLNLPGPVGVTMLPVLSGNATRAGTPCWSWNGSMDKPTLKPSLLVKGTLKLNEDQYEQIMAGAKIKPRDYRCHTWITDGKVQFLDDSTHSLRGRTVDLLEVEK